MAVNGLRNALPYQRKEKRKEPVGAVGSREEGRGKGGKGRGKLTIDKQIKTQTTLLRKLLSLKYRHQHGIDTSFSTRAVAKLSRAGVGFQRESSADFVKG